MTNAKAQMSNQGQSPNVKMIWILDFEIDLEFGF